MENDPDLELQRRLAVELAEARLKVLACQEKVMRSEQQLTQARAVMADTQRRLYEAYGLLDELQGMPWTQIGKSN